MDFSGRYRLSADRETVWRGLNDPEILKQSIPGCEELNQDSETAFSATVVVRLGPVKAKFNGAVELKDLNPPESYTLSGEGKGGVAGFGKGDARIALIEAAPGVTILDYAAEAQIGGKLAQIGSRLIRGSVKKLTGDFFTNFAGALNAEVEELPIDDGAASA